MGLDPFGSIWLLAVLMFAYFTGWWLVCSPHVANGPIAGRQWIAVPGAKPDCSTWCVLSVVPIYAESTISTMDGLTIHGTHVPAFAARTASILMWLAAHDGQVGLVTKFPAWHLDSRPPPELGLLNRVDPLSNWHEPKGHRACAAVWTWRILDICRFLSVIKSQKSFVSGNINGGMESAWDLCQSLVGLSLAHNPFS